MMSDLPNPFDRFTSHVQFALFPAMQRDYQDNASCLGTDHLLAGLINMDYALAERIFNSAQLESLQKTLAVETTLPEPSPRRDMPLSPELMEIFSASETCAEKFGEQRVGTRHLLLELLRHAECRAARIAKQCGVHLVDCAEKLEISELSLDIIGLRNSLTKYMIALGSEKAVTVMPECPLPVPPRSIFSPLISVIPSIRPPEARLWAPRPFLCIEVVTSGERMSSLTQRIESYLKAGVRHVWALSSASRHAYEATAETGLREVKAAALKTENPVLELPLAEVFS